MQEINTYSVGYAADYCHQDRQLHWGRCGQKAGSLVIKDITAVTPVWTLVYYLGLVYHGFKMHL